MKNIFFLFFIISTGVVYAQKNTCKKWRNGTFIVYTSEGKTTTITRKGSQQIEVNNVTGIREELKVTWVNKCTYQISRKKKDAISKGKHPELTVVVKIIDSYDDHCLIYVYSNQSGDVGYYDCMYLVPQKGKQVTP